METIAQLHLEISPEVQRQAWQVARTGTSAIATWQTYLNQVCLNTFLPWLRLNYAPGANAETNTALLSGWDIVNGTAITLNNQRLILIPNQTIDTSELLIPQEWVDLPGWAGDYYLAAQVNSDESWIRIWGYTTHEQIKAIADCDADDRTYHVDAQDLILDLGVLWVVRQLYSGEVTQAAIAPLPTISAAQADNLLHRLASLDVLQPRLELPFQLWGALLERENWQQRLYQLRHAPQASQVVNLGQWLQNVFEEGWQSLESVLTGEELAFNFRQVTDLTETVARRVKLINLPDQSALLLVALEPETDGRIGVRSQLRPLDRTLHLPSNLRLSLLSSTGEIIQSVEARSQDNLIQLRRFRSALGTRFRLQIELDDTLLAIEDFQL
ncbi:MAG: DUF1822 family protein [Leptolyngbyaceae cyanobacterium CSU_1_3]|nr:DUF1822 family protein [Leptolyngbyaceae cyanobacterium CSU_1_3]